MRIVTVNGSMRLYLLFQIVPSITVLERLVKEGMQSKGWNIKSVSIVRNSYLNNTLQITIEVNAIGSDVSQRIDDGLTAFLSNFVMDGDVMPFRDVNLRVTSDTGYIPKATGAVGQVASQKPQKITIIRKSSQQPIDGG